MPPQLGARVDGLVRVESGIALQPVRDLLEGLRTLHLQMHTLPWVEALQSRRVSIPLGSVSRLDHVAVEGVARCYPFAEGQPLAIVPLERDGGLLRQNHRAKGAVAPGRVRNRGRRGGPSTITCMLLHERSL